MKTMKEILSLGSQTPTSRESSETKENKFGLYRVDYDLSQKKKSYQCELCQDREIVEIGIDAYGSPIFTPCSCKIKREAAKKIASSGLSRKNLRYRLEDYKVNNNNREMFEGVVNYLKVWPELLNADTGSKGFGLIGTPGVGKTMLSSIIAKNMIDAGISVVFVPTTDLMAELKQAQFAEDKDQNMEAKVEMLSKVDALILDDLGSEKPTPWIQSMYYRVVDMRYRNDRLTAFSSNLIPKDLAEWLGDDFGPKTVSRLIEMTKDYFFVVRDKDHRLGG